MLENIWEFKVQILPALIFLLLYEFPSLIRKLKKTFYTPIYFSIFPLKEINQDLSQYLAKDDYLYQSTKLTSHAVEKLRKKIVFVSIISSIIDILVVPLFMGVFTSFFLSKKLFFQFLIILLIYKSITVFLSLKDSHYYFISSKYKLILLSFIYILYLGIITEMLKTSYSWAIPFVSTEDWFGLWSSFSSIIFGKIFAEGLIFAIFGAVVTNYMINKKRKESNID